MNELLLILLAYLIGSIPTSVWVSQHFFDIDIRDYGSGNAGATNTYRVLGPKWGTIVMIADMVKGVVAVKLALLLPEYADSEVNLQNLQTLLGLAAFTIRFPTLFTISASLLLVEATTLLLERNC